MCPAIIILLLIQYVCNGFLPAESTPDKWFTQVPAKYLLNPGDYQRISQFTPSDKNPYTMYFGPVVGGDFIWDTKRNYEKVLGGSRKSVNKALVLKEVPYVKRNSRNLSPYLEPPAPDATSIYAKYRNAMVNEKIPEINEIPLNHRPEAKNINTPEKIADPNPMYIRDHAPMQSGTQTVSESKHKVNKKSKNKDPTGTLELSADGDRIEFQIQGHEGPKTYIFGFDTGDGKNRQFRLEEKLKDGTVKGHYGYYDARGKLRTIRYLARPIEGYQEKHHESNNLSSENE